MVIDITPAPILSKGWGTPTNAALETLAAQAQTADEVTSIASAVADAKFAEVSVDLVDATMTATAETPSSDFAQHLNGTIAAVADRRATLVVLGDSLTEQGGMKPGDLNRNRTSFWTWGLNLSGQRLDMVGNLGVGGEVSADVLARVGAAVALAPGWVHLLVGTNDVSTGVAPATTITNITATVSALRAAGIRVFIGTIPPRTGATTPQKLAQGTINAAIRQLPSSIAGVVLCDYEPALTDPATGDYPSGWSTDGVHFINGAGFASGRVFSEAIKSVVPIRDRFSASKTDPKNLLGNSGRFYLGDGSPAGGWQQSQYAVMPTNTRPARTDSIYGAWQQAIVPVGDRVTYTVNVPISASMAVGDTVELFLEYDVSAIDAAMTGANRMLTAGIQAYVGGSFTGPNQRFDLWMVSGAEAPPITARSGVFRSPPLTIPAGTSLVQCFVYAWHGGTFRFDRATLRKVT